jgi:hypothetical protein
MQQQPLVVEERAPGLGAKIKGVFTGKKPIAEERVYQEKRY